jgi:hypothetical protein
MFLYCPVARARKIAKFRKKLEMVIDADVVDK